MVEPLVGYSEYLPTDGALSWEEKWNAHRQFIRDFICKHGWIKDAYKQKVVAKVNMRVHPDDYSALQERVFLLWNKRVEDGKNFAPVTVSYLCRKFSVSYTHLTLLTSDLV